MVDLYNEDIDQQLDAETGAVVDVNELEIQKQLLEAEAYEAMIKLPGWQHLSEHMLAQIDSCKEKLIDVTLTKKSVGKIRRLQQSARIYSNIIGFVQQKAAEAQVLRDQLAVNVDAENLED